MGSEVVLWGEKGERKATFKTPNQNGKSSLVKIIKLSCEYIFNSMKLKFCYHMERNKRHYTWKKIFHCKFGRPLKRVLFKNAFLFRWLWFSYLSVWVHLHLLVWAISFVVLGACVVARHTFLNISIRSEILSTYTAHIK